MFCNDTSKKKSVIDQKVDSQLVIDDDRPWILRCDFYDGGRSFVDRNDYIYLDYLGQLVQIGEKLPSSNPQFSWIYSIQTGTYLDLYNDLMGTNQYGVDGNGIIWGNLLMGFLKLEQFKNYIKCTNVPPTKSY